MRATKFKTYLTLGQIGLWSIFYLINFMDVLDYFPILESFIYSMNYTLMFIVIVYIHYFWVFPLFLKSQRVLYFITTFLLITFFYFLYTLIEYHLPFEYEGNYEEDVISIDVIIYDYLLVILILGINSLQYFVEAWFENIKKESALKSEKLAAELNFLKSQINPHFLFNTLNNIYSFAQTGNEKTAPMLERLSSILRFMVYDCSADKVELRKELHAIDDLLEIYKMKNSQQQNITLSTNGVKAYHLIAPLILVNFVENAFKHSDAVNNKEGFIYITITVNDFDKCQCVISNSIRKKASSNSPYKGVGLENVKKRLELQYQDKYHIKEKKEENLYTVVLDIPLERKK